ncbi:hypothetical protein GOV05_03685 [Candidatus Woesearchaeota archaeon]|nr:hypothetical protein [Candidatus Woesearchaeota archaeon]
MFKNKKAQLTMFIILGIILLFSAALFFYIKGEIIIGGDFEDLIGTTPMEAQPVKEYVDQCLYNIGKEAIIRIGENGGYIEIDPATVTIIPGRPTLSEGLEIVPNTDIVVPYWFFMSSDDTCQNGCVFEDYLKPKLKKTGVDDLLTIEGQIASFVEENLGSCLRDFDSFEQVGMSVSASNPVADAVIDRASKYVSIRLRMPLSIEKGGVNTSLEYFLQKFDVGLYNMYNLATHLTRQELKNYYLEQVVTNLITIFSGLNNSIIPPPYGGVDFFLSNPIQTWDKKEVKLHIQNFLNPYVANLKPTNTLAISKVVNLGDDQWSDTVNKLNYVIDLELGELLLPFDVQFVYSPDWPIYLDVSPSLGDFILPDRSYPTIMTFLGYGLTRYDFSYDVSFPVLIKISDEAAFKGEGYDFYFAMEANLRNNQALFASNSDNYVSNDEAEQSLICTDEASKTGDVTIEVRDYLTQEEISHVSIFSEFAGVSCRAGETSSPFVGKLKAGIGHLTLTHPDYLSVNNFLVLVENKTYDFSFEMYPEKTLNVSVFKKMISKSTGWGINDDQVFSEEGNEQVILTFERVPDEDSKQRIKKTVFFYDDYSPKSVKLYPGEYELSIVYMNTDEFTIPRETKKVGPWWNRKTITIPAMDLTLGFSLDYNESEYNLLISPDELYDKKDLELGLLIPDFYREQQSLNSNDLKVLEDISKYHKQNYEEIKLVLR